MYSKNVLLVLVSLILVALIAGCDQEDRGELYHKGMNVFKGESARPYLDSYLTEVARIPLDSVSEALADSILSVGLSMLYTYEGSKTIGECNFRLGEYSRFAHFIERSSPIHQHDAYLYAYSQYNILVGLGDNSAQVYQDAASELMRGGYIPNDFNDLKRGFADLFDPDAYTSKGYDQAISDLSGGYYLTASALRETERKEAWENSKEAAKSLWDNIIEGYNKVKDEVKKDMKKK